MVIAVCGCAIRGRFVASADTRGVGIHSCEIGCGDVGSRPFVIGAERGIRYRIMRRRGSSRLHNGRYRGRLHPGDRWAGRILPQKRHRLYIGGLVDDSRNLFNGGEPSVGRAAVEEVARSFMAGFPDMVVELVELRQAGDKVQFHWHWTGTNSGPGGNGAAVDMTGYEEWTFNDEGLIQFSDGNYDEAEYQRQLSAGVE